MFYTKFILAMIFVSNMLMAYDFNVKDYEYLEANKNVYMDKARHDYGHLDNNQSRIDASLKDINTTQLSQNDIFDPKTLQYFMPPEYINDIQRIKTSAEETNKKYMTVFWFFTSSLPDAAMENYVLQAKRLKEKYPNFQYFAVLRGFPKGINIVEYANQFKDKKGADGLKVKIHPMLFKKMNLTQVPAFALAFCPTNHFAHKECEFQYLAKGDMTLSYFFEKVGDVDSRYKRFYFDINEAR